MVAINCECGQTIDSRGYTAHRRGGGHEAALNRKRWHEEHPSGKLFPISWRRALARWQPEGIRWDIVSRVYWFTGSRGRPGYFVDAIGIDPEVSEDFLYESIARAKAQVLAERRLLTAEKWIELKKLVPIDALRRAGIPRRRVADVKRIEATSPEGQAQEGVEVCLRNWGDGSEAFWYFYRDGRSWWCSRIPPERLANLVPLARRQIMPKGPWLRQGEWHFTPVRRQPDCRYRWQSKPAKVDLPYPLGGGHHIVVNAKKVHRLYGRVEASPGTWDTVQYLILGPARIEHQRGDHDPLELGPGPWLAFCWTVD